MIERWAKLPVEVEVASEFRYREPVLRPGALVIGITQSGETADTLAAIRLARSSGAYVIALTNVDPDSPITKSGGDWTTIQEELYNNVRVFDTAHPLQKGKQHLVGKDGKESDAEAVVTWTNEYDGKTKVFATTLGHNNATVSDDRYLDLVTRGLLWSLGKLDDAHLKPAKKVLLDEK